MFALSQFAVGILLSDPGSSEGWPAIAQAEQNNDALHAAEAVDFRRKIGPLRTIVFFGGEGEGSFAFLPMINSPVFFNRCSEARNPCF